jgi:histidinol-phosphate/aromatic aminotransferase/cobyric acid decarboxylase-like protein
MAYTVDFSLFENLRHNPSYAGLQKSMGTGAKELRDYCIPVNPYFPTPEIFDRLRKDLESILRYYPEYNEKVAATLTETLGGDPDTVVLGNGSTELITWINRLFVTESVAIPIPTFSRWTDEPEAMHRRVHAFLRPEVQDFNLDPDEFAAFVHRKGAQVAVLCNPNNPTGAFMPVDQVVRLLDRLSDIDLVVIDESFADFVDEKSIPSVASEAVQRHNVVVLKSLGKNFGLHGLRMGYAVANPRVVKEFRKALPFWNLNAMAVKLIGLLPGYRKEYEAGRRQVVRDRVALERDLRAIPELKVFPSSANFVYFRVPDSVHGIRLRNHLLSEYGYLVRECGNKAGSSQQYFRVAARPAEERGLLVRALRESLSDVRVRDERPGTPLYIYGSSRH